LRLIPHCGTLIEYVLKGKASEIEVSEGVKGSSEGAFFFVVALIFS
jgi:hypothetical protein